MSPRSALGALGLLLVSACGTTVPQATQTTGNGFATGPGPQEQSTGVVAGGATAAPAPQARGQLPGGSTGASTGGSLSSTGGRGGPTQLPSTPGTTPLVGRGVSLQSINIGFYQRSDSSATGDAFGFKGLSALNPKDIVQALVADLNARGGLAGRRVVPTYLGWKNNDSQSTTAKAQQACSFFTSDHKVFAVVAEIWPDGWKVLQSCLASHGVVLVGNGTNDDSGNYTAAGKYLYGATLASLDGYARSLVQAMRTARELSSTVKVGIIHYDTPALRRATGVLTSSLRAAGVAPPQSVEVTYPPTTADVGSTDAAVQAAVLKFNSSGVKQVFFVDGGGSLALFFMLHAESQQYRPHYGLTTSNLPDILQQNVPAAQLNGSFGVGSFPALDLGDYKRFSTPPWTRCANAMARSGRAVASAADKEAVAFICAPLDFLSTALNSKPSITPTPDTLRQAVNGWTAPREATTGFSAVYGSGRSFGPLAGRVFRWDGSRFAYTGQAVEFR